MSANHSDCRYVIRGDPVPVTGTRYTTITKTEKVQLKRKNC